MNAREILEELWLKEENYTKNQWEYFERLIKSYNDEDIEELQDQVNNLEDDVYSLKDERDELQEKVDELTDELEEAKKEIEDLQSNQK